MAENTTTMVAEAPQAKTQKEEAAELGDKLGRLQARCNELGIEVVLLAFQPVDYPGRRVLGEDGAELPIPTVVVSGPLLIEPGPLSSLLGRLAAVTANAAEREFARLVKRVEEGTGDEADKAMAAYGADSFIGNALLRLLPCLSIALRDLHLSLLNAGAPPEMLEAMCAYPETALVEGPGEARAQYESAQGADAPQDAGKAGEPGPVDADEDEGPGEDWDLGHDEE